MPPSPKKKKSAKVEEDEESKDSSKDSCSDLDKALIDAKITYLEERGKKATAEDDTLAQTLGNELSPVQGPELVPRLMKVLQWQLKRAETALKDTKEVCAKPLT